jgi:hypothetical protein
MISELSPREFEAILRSDLGCFAERCFYSRPAIAPNCHARRLTVN